MDIQGHPHNDQTCLEEADTLDLGADGRGKSGPVSFLRVPTEWSALSSVLAGAIQAFVTLLIADEGGSGACEEGHREARFSSSFLGFFRFLPLFPTRKQSEHFS